MIRFSHIYIEEDAYHYPITSQILTKYQNSIQIKVQNYKQIFNRPNQNFQEQKNSVKLILAVKKDNFYYKGSSVVNDYGFENFYYNTLILNCVYNCEYCYLQGMFSSGNIVVFVNVEDYFRETEKLLTDKPTYLCISYETDLLAMEDLVPYTSSWINFARLHPNLTIEIRTKSNKYHLIKHLKPCENVILAWTISPDEIVKRYESKTPTLNRRLSDIQLALCDGWRVRLCFDPILHVKNWKEIYGNFVDFAFTRISAEKIFDISLGTFRINADYLKKMKKLRPDSDILYYPFDRSGQLSIYPEGKVIEIMEFMTNRITKFYERDKVFRT